MSTGGWLSTGVGSLTGIILLLGAGVAQAAPLPVAHSATGYEGEVLVDWRMGTEAGVLGYNVFRSRYPDLGFVQVNAALVLAAGRDGARYYFLDRTADNGVRFYYRIEVVDLRGGTSFSGLSEALPTLGGGAASPAPGLYQGSGTVQTGTGTVSRPDPLTPPAGTGGVDPSLAEKLLGIDAATAGIRVLSYDSSEAILEILPPEPVLEVVSGPDGPRTRVAMAGYSQTLDPRGPQVPARRILLATPAVSRIEVTILTAEARVRTGLTLPRPSPAFTVDPAAGSTPPGAGGGGSGSSPGRELSIMEQIRQARREWMERIRESRRQMDDERRTKRSLLFQAFQRGRTLGASLPLSGGTGTLARGGSPEEPGFWPGTLLTFDRLLRSGEERYALLVVLPVQVRAGEVHIYRRIVAKVHFLDPSPEPPEGALTPGGAVDTPTQVRLAADGNVLKVHVTADGLYRMTRAELAAAGLDVARDPRSIRMYHLGREIPIRVEGETDGVFNPGDVVSFYGTRNPWRTEDNDRLTRYTDENVYWLEIGRWFGQRLGEGAAAPGGGAPAEEGPADVHYEVNSAWFPRLFKDFEVSEFDHWMDPQFLYNTSGGANPNRTRTYTLDATGISASPHTARLDYAFAGVSNYINDPDYDHHVVIEVNGTRVADAYWFDREPHAGSVEFPSTLLVAGANSIRLTVPCDIPTTPTDYAFTNYLRLAFQRRHQVAGDAAPLVSAGAGDQRVTGFSGGAVAALDVTDPSRPVWLTGVDVQPDGPLFAARFRAPRAGRYHLAGPAGVLSPTRIARNVSSTLHVDGPAADYLAVGPASLLAAIDPLVAHRRSEGLSVLVADLEDIYDEFTAGLPDPVAIRAFVRASYDGGLPSPPRFLLLTGKGHYDPHNYRGTSPADLTPVKMLDGIYQYSASDSWYVAVAGNDVLPDLCYGRLIGRDAVEISDQVAKILAYETTSPPGAWEDRITLVSDNPDAAGDFDRMNDDLAPLFPPAYAVEKIYLSQLGLAATQTRIRDALNAGCLLVNYHGHGFINRWANENLFDTVVAAALTNADRYVLFNANNCLNGHFQNPAQISLGEVVAKSPGKGAVGFLGSTSLTIADPQILMSQAFVRYVFTDGIVVAGEAQRRAMIAFYGGNPWEIEYDDDVIRSWVYFGDPATRLRVP